MPPRDKLHADALKPPPPQTWRNMIHILVLVLALAFMLTWIFTSSVQERLGLGYWPSFILVILATLISVPLALFSLITASIMIRNWRIQSERYDLSLARKSAGTEGSLVRDGPVTAWFSEPEDRMDLLQPQREASRRRFAALVDESVAVDQPVRVLCFSRKTDYAAYTMRLGMSLGYLEGVYLFGKPRRLVICAEVEQERPIDPERTLRILWAYYFLEKYQGFLPESWLSSAVANVVAGTSDPGDLARLNRKMMAAIARNSVLGAEEMFHVASRTILQRAQRWNEYENYTYFAQFYGQARSIGEYLCGDGAPPERRERFRGFLKELGKKDRYEQVFERHFGHGFGQLLTDWQAWVRTQGLGSHTPPPVPIKQAILRHVIPFISDPSVEAGEVILAVRDLAGAGFVLGADALIELLREDDPNLRREAAWALESIAGIAAGEDLREWRQWWRNLPADAESVGGSLSFIERRG